MNRSTSLLAEAADSLALAVITSSNAPVLLLDDNLIVIAASDSFCDTFELDPIGVAGSPLSAAGRRRMGRPQLTSLLKATAAGAAEIAAYEMDLIRAGQVSRRLVINARKLDYFDADNVRLVVSVADVTSARIDEKLKDDLLREKAILLQELQHRVANSLQIIASVLMQGAQEGAVGTGARASARRPQPGDVDRHDAAAARRVPARRRRAAGLFHRPLREHRRFDDQRPRPAFA